LDPYHRLHTLEFRVLIEVTNSINFKSYAYDMPYNEALKLYSPQLGTEIEHPGIWLDLKFDVLFISCELRAVADYNPLEKNRC
jgi:hypothetical protein